MSKIDDLIQELCPDGVEYKTLGGCCLLKRGKVITRKETREGEYPVVSGGRVPSYYIDKFNRKGETITVAGSGAYAGHLMYWEQPIWVGDSFSIEPESKEELNSKFLYYYLSNKQHYIYGLKKGSGVPHVKPSDVESLKIPVPPMGVQQEIVRVLDSFAELEAELEVELEAELERRKAQYAYYRDKLLTFSNSETYYSEQIRWVRLGEVAHYVNEKELFTQVSAGLYIGVNELLQDFKGINSEQEVIAEGKLSKFSNGDILLGNIRPYLKKMWLANCSGGTNGDVLVIRANDLSTLSSKYLFHVLTSDLFVNYNVQNSRGGKMPRGNKKAILKYTFPLPPLEEQQRVVDILGKFDALVNDISQGLPAEIEARCKQYEYYRDKLLTFKKKEN